MFRNRTPITGIFECKVTMERGPFQNNWYSMSSPIPIILCVAFYLLFSIKLGPWLMKDRKPFLLKVPLLIHNSYQILISLWLTYLGLSIDGTHEVFFGNSCQISNSNSKNFLTLSSTAALWFFLSKITDFIDTIFFVLRKKHEKITFLHIYHHSTTALITWFFAKCLADHLLPFVGTLNAMVHVIMYSYYLISSMGPKYKKYLWWKRYVTIIQLFQFCLINIYLLLLLLKGCKITKAHSYFIMFDVTILFILFSNFYYKTYIIAPQIVKRDKNINLDAESNNKIQNNVMTLDKIKKYD